MFSGVGAINEAGGGACSGNVFTNQPGPPQPWAEGPVQASVTAGGKWSRHADRSCYPVLFTPHSTKHSCAISTHHRVLNVLLLSTSLPLHCLFLSEISQGVDSSCKWETYQQCVIVFMCRVISILRQVPFFGEEVMLSLFRLVSSSFCLSSPPFHVVPPPVCRVSSPFHVRLPSCLLSFLSDAVACYLLSVPFLR